STLPFATAPQTHQTSLKSADVDLNTAENQFAKRGEAITQISKPFRDSQNFPANFVRSKSPPNTKIAWGVGA
ncbi:hypothetical protein, partial [Rivularia sp. UHCC 0363]|uniref:hypothetical protein n=1 Tax=Rivularia sp. UHCC 0363 TaxID=3110244 RepID=UPI002B214941